MIAALPGDYGKPRPHVVVQSDAFDESHPSVILCPITSRTRGIPFRVPVAPEPSTGLRMPSEVMVDKLQSVRRDRISGVIGRIRDDAISQLDASLALVLGLRS